jgi:paraquat-inducible protein B
VVKPRLFAGNLSGLETVLSGSYIAILPSTTPGTESRAFTGLEDPPVLDSTVPGRTFTLKAKRLGSIELGSQIYYRGLVAGEVLGWDIQNMAESVLIHAFIRAPFDQYVHTESRFWNASGVSLDMGASGIQLRVESLRALLLGGISFDTPDEAKSIAAAAKDSVFPLYDNAEDADNAAFTRHIEAVAFFPGSIDGLAPGAPVTMLGIRVGQVTSVRLEYDAQSDTVRVPVRFLIEPERIGDIAAIQGRGPLENARRLVHLGLRAQLVSANLLTGQKAIALAFLPNSPPAEITLEGNVMVMPTATGQFTGIIDSVNSVLTKVSAMPFEEIGANLNSTLHGINSMTNGPEVKQALASLNTAMNAAKDLLVNINSGSTAALKRLPEIAAGVQEAVNRASQLMGAIDKGYGDNSKMYRNLDRLMIQLNDTAQSVRVLSDTLARHPEALVRGLPDSNGVQK